MKDPRDRNTMSDDDDSVGEGAYLIKSTKSTISNDQVPVTGLTDGLLIGSFHKIIFYSHFSESRTQIRLVCKLTEMQQSNSHNNLNFIFPSPMSSSSFVHPPQQPTASFAPSQPDDPNSPVLFKHNINLVQTQISTIRSLAHEALNAMCVLFIFIRVLPPGGARRRARSFS